MYDMTDVAMADKLAGGPRADLDDVIIAEPMRMRKNVWHVPAGYDVLEYLRRQTEEHETIAAFKKFYEDPNAEWLDVIIAIRDDRHHGDSPRRVSQTFLRYGEDLYERCPWLTIRDVWEHLVELGFPYGKWAVYRHFNRVGLSASARTKEASRS